MKFTLLIISILAFHLAQTTSHNQQKEVEELYREELSFDDAVEFCKLRGARLLALFQEFRQRNLYRWMQKKEIHNLWISLNRRNDTENTEPNKFYFEGYNLPSPNPTYWGPGEPNNMNNNERCVEVRLLAKNSELSNWNDAPCSNKNQFMCSTRIFDEEKQ